MAKKKKQAPKDDLIENLLDDVNGIAADDSIQDQVLDDGSTVGAVKKPVSSEEGIELPSGMSSAPKPMPNASMMEGNPWDSLEAGLGSPKDEFERMDLSDSPRPIDTEGNSFSLPGVPEGMEGEAFQGPSVGEGEYQSADRLDESPRFESAEGFENEATRPISAGEAFPSEDRTMALGSEGAPPSHTQGVNDHEKTLAADGFANRRVQRNEPQEKVVIGSLRGARGGSVQTAMDASLAQAENLKIAQQRILDLEKENDRLRQENEEVASAADIIRGRLEELTSRITLLEREKNEQREASQNEIMILKGNLQFKESEVAKARLKIDELETRLRNDFKKIRVKERELENRLELARAEKAALVRAKDENILELKRKIDQSQSEIDNYREKLLEMNRTIEANQEQFKRTVRAMRLALASLEAKDENVVPIKKAE